MTRIFSEFAYGPGPRAGCWWDETIAPPEWPEPGADTDADVGVIGGGFTGMSAALHLAKAGAKVVVFEANTPGWGASGRNGGFCCLGGSMLDDAKLTRQFGAEGAQGYDHAEQDAVALVADLLRDHNIDADVHSKGETLLAHRPRDMAILRRKADDPSLELIEPEDLVAHGMAGPFFGALTTPHGFALNPRKYLFGLAKAAQHAGADLFQNAQVTAITRAPSGFVLTTRQGRVRCKSVVIATNGYSSETLPDWLAGRYMPSQSNVMVTRPLTENEIAAQGWSSGQMCYDTRGLLHYFRLMPDRRFLFGMRGGLVSSAAAEASSRRRVRRDFDRMFPAWSHVEAPHMWSGMVCLARHRVPFVGQVPGEKSMFAGLAYHGNGVAMGSYCGKLLAGLVLGKDQVPVAMRQPLARFPLGAMRRLVMPPLYAWRALRDL
ncbi:MAG: NAD(P)/FAD-dependent oxidoreductase [Sedimentitalea sp.]